MQKLNGREYYVVVLIFILVILQSFFLYRELFSETSPFITAEDGSFVNVQQRDIINIAILLLQILLNFAAFVFLLMKKRPGWILSFSSIFFYAFLLSYLLVNGAIAGFIDSMFYIGVAFVVLMLLAIIFLCIPSTREKYSVTRKAFIPVLLILALLSTIYFIIPK
jgi:hypothetical protein